MSTVIETKAFLHSHGLDVESEELNAHFRAAIRAIQSFYCSKPGRKALSASEGDVARSGGLDPHKIIGQRPDPLLESVNSYVRLIQSGLTTRQAAEKLGVSEVRIRQRIKEGTLLALRDGKSWKLLIFQFTERGELPGWGSVAQELPRNASPVAVERWLLLPHPDLVSGEGESPISPRAWLLNRRPPKFAAALASELA